ncbi:uncharacterized protein LOC110026666 [Phalaenopsis equestris]|uniref:uncharacterized protein LOC110026666 n=1 Tax=Phalaenopsis equestris TaxID=78828 RepID=UPI0009E525AE|nr:uncharacterized protein LOC110026666 [Phalaenopsis equestris]
MDEGDSLTLADLFKSLLHGASPIDGHSVHPSSAERRRSMKCKSAKRRKRSPLRSVVIGDFVWAMAYPLTWWPGQIESCKGPLMSVSFFGCNKTRCFSSSDILRFEEAYPRMIKMVGMKLSNEIGLALDELAGSIAVGLKCCCRVSAVDKDGSLAVKKGFNPEEIQRFLLDKAVSPRVVGEEFATVVRVSAALNSFRCALVVCNTSEVDEGFCTEAVLNFVHDMAVNLCVDGKAVAQLLAFRKFVSVKPSWFYQPDWEFEEDSLDSHEIEVDLELPDFTSEDELYHRRTMDQKFDVSIKPQEEYQLLDLNMHEGSEMCVLNMVDLCMFDTDEKFESPIYDQHQSDTNATESTHTALHENTSDASILLSCTEGASATSSNSELGMSSPQTCPNHSLQVLSSSESTLLRTVPLYTGRLHNLPINKCSIYSPFNALKCFNPTNTAQSIALIPEMAPFAETSLQISPNKRKLYELTTSKNYKSTQMSLPCTETFASSVNVHNVIDRALFVQNQPFLKYSGHVSKICYRNRPRNHHFESNPKAFYISPLMRNNRSKPLDRKNRIDSSVSVLLNMKFPKDYSLPSKEELEKKFSVFGPLDHTRTKVFFYTGVGQVVFLHQADAVVAYNYVTKKRIFGKANVRFWFYKYEICRNDCGNASLNAKPCLRKPCTPELINDDKNNCRVRFAT